jgi:hypothetical protein
MNPLNRPMFVAKFNRGGSVYISPALRYMAQNPDVFNASIANADARGLQGLARQAQIERDAELHYAFHGQPEGRAYGGRTFLGGLLEPRLGDTFGLSPERREELIQERDAPSDSTGMITPPPTNNELVPLVPIDDFEGPGDGGMAEGGEVKADNGYQSSAVVQGYLAANPDVLANATQVARSRGIAPGSEFQRVVENTAREHFRNFGMDEGRQVAGYADNGRSLMQEEVTRLPSLTRPTEGIASVPVNPRMLAFAKILANTYDLPDPGTDGELRAEFRNRGGGRGASTVTDIYDLTGIISPSLRDRLIDRFYGSTNEDKLPGRVDDIISYMFRRNLDGDNAFEVTGGTEGLLRAYGQLGITGEGDSYADRGARGIMNLFRPTDRSSINFDGTGGADDIGLGGPTGQGYTGPLAFQNFLGDVPAMFEQAAVVPTVNPLGLANTGRKILNRTLMDDPFDMGEYGSRIGIGLSPQFGGSFQEADVSLED